MRQTSARSSMYAGKVAGLLGRAQRPNAVWIFPLTVRTLALRQKRRSRHAKRQVSVASLQEADRRLNCFGVPPGVAEEMAIVGGTNAFTPRLSARARHSSAMRA